jgi:hypothetical protein
VETTIRRRRRPFKRPGAHASAVLLWAAFLAVFVLLALQMSSAPEEPPVLVRRIVVTKVAHDAPAASAPAAPAPAAPAPVAPAPAPVTTQSS